MPTQDARERAVRLKLNPIRDVVEGRSVTVIDDSIVRGTTSNQLVQLLRDVGAEEVHVRIGAPAIVAPCYMGIDMATREELIAAEQSADDICEEIGADSLAYLSIDAVAGALDQSRADLCLGCVTGEYPYDIEGETTDRDVERPVIGGDEERERTATADD
jgi:amidophosphoribosyltransferase